MRNVPLLEFDEAELWGSLISYSPMIQSHNILIKKMQLKKVHEELNNALKGLQLLIKMSGRFIEAPHCCSQAHI